MKKEIITETLRKLSYKNISMDTTDGRNQIADELLKASKPTKPVYVYESPDGGNTIYRRERGSDERVLMMGFENPTTTKWEKVPTTDDE